MPNIARVSSVFLSLVAALSVGSAACGDDGGGTGGAGGDASTSSGATASTGAPASTTSSGDVASSSGAQGGGDAGGGAQGGGDAGGGDAGGGGTGGEAPACTVDAPPDAACGEDDVGQTCQVDVAGGGCPDTKIVWRCTAVEGGPVWYRSVDTSCFCSVESEEEACTALPGCVWAAPPDDTCAEETDAFPIEETGCFRELCGTPGFSYFGVVGDACQADLCDAFPPD